MKRKILVDFQVCISLPLVKRKDKAIKLQPNNAFMNGDADNQYELML